MPRSTMLLRMTALLPLVLASVGSLRAETIPAKPPVTANHQPFSEPTRTDLPPRVLFGDMHLHTDTSFDAGTFGTKLGPDEAFRFARGEEVVSTTGLPAKLRRPLDFLLVSDHSDYMGLPLALRNSDPLLVSDPAGRKWVDSYHATDETRFKMFPELVADILAGKPRLTATSQLLKTGWERNVAAAEKYNEPGRFTALIGFEWSSMPNGDNLHRIVLFRDNADRALQVLPLPTFGSPDPETLWHYLASYQEKTGGQALAIPHNSNLSGGLMFADRTFSGKPFDRAYAEERQKWEPLVEASQTKGDSETHPVVSPDDEFANFERWDKANILGNRPDKPEEQQFNYVRPTLTRGLKYEATLGANPFKFGLIAATDSHTGMSTADADNFFGAIPPTAEPNPHRIDNIPSLGKITPKSRFVATALMEASSGLSCVWATSNTREAIYDAFRRKEVYGTTGPRMTVRVFAGFDFKPGDEARSDFALNGYAHGVPMGGDLTAAPEGRKPTLVIQAAKDPDGANIDRVQVIKGWVDAQNNTHEKIYDVAYSGDRRPGADGKLPLVGNTVDVSTATYNNTIGAPVLTTAWTDPDFDAANRAYYYLRVIEIPTPRWSTYDAVRFGKAPPKGFPTSVTQRAYTSPIWYTPKAANGNG